MRMPKKSSREYLTVNLPKKLAMEIDHLIKGGAFGYQSRSEFFKDSVRKNLRELRATRSPPPLPILEHFNLNETGIRILDRSLSSKTSSGRIIDIVFKPDKVWCEYCESSKCQHAKFALELQPVQEILSKKGWTIKA